MSLLAPFALLALALAAPLVLLYFVRLRRRERRVSSLLLWEAEAAEQKAPALLQRFQRDPLLVLQLAALAAIVLGLARPAITLPGEGERKVVIVLDTSASMKATDVPPSRFAVARAKATELVRALRQGTEVMVIEAGVQPRVTAAASRERARALEAIGTAAARDLPNRLGDAVRTARALVGSDPRAEIHVFTDGAFAEVPEAGDPRIRWTGVGRRGHNLAVTGLAVRKQHRGHGNYEAFVALANFSNAAQRFGFVLRLDDRAIVERELTLGANVRRSLILPFQHAGAARIAVELAVDDDLATDNVAYAVLPPPRRTAVTLVTEGNRFLENVLRTDPEVALEVVPPAAYAGGMGAADVVVLDSATPARVGPGRYIFVNTVPPDVPIELLGRAEHPEILDWDRTHEVMRHVDFSKVVIEEGMRLRPLAPGRALVETRGGPLVYALEEPDRKAILFGFDLFRADLPLRVAFPLIVSNALRWLYPGGSDNASLQIAAGEPLLFPVAHDVEAATLTTPRGRKVGGHIARGVASYTETDEVGVYTLAAGRGETGIAVNLMDAEESNLAPRPLPAAPPAAATALVPVQRELWPLAIGLAVLLLAVEGALYWRRQSAGRGRFRLPAAAADRWSLALRGVLLAVLCGALARPTFAQWQDRMNVVFLLDRSASVSPEARARALRFVEEAVADKRPGDRHALVAFGAQAVVAERLSTAPRLEHSEAEPDARGTNIFQGIQLALAMLPPGESNRIVLLSDGRQNAGNAAAGAQAAKEAGADLHYVAAPLGLEQEVIAEELVLPQEVKFGEPFQARLVAWSEKAASGRVSLFRNGEFIGSQPVELAAGKNVFSYRQALDAEGIHVYQAALEVEGDAIPQNNRAVATVLVRGRPRVLIAGKDRRQAQPLAAALRAQNIDVTVVAPEAIPKDLAGLQRYDELVLANVSSIRLTRAQMVHIRDYVRDHGGGLIMVGGEESFGLGGYYRTPIEEALPVTMEVRRNVDIPNLALVLSIDRSGSMSMMAQPGSTVTPLDLAKEAAQLVVDLLDERSEIGVMSWDTRVTWDYRLAPARDKDAIYRAIASLVAGGGTDGIPALAESYAALAKRPALLKHVIFLSDGQMLYREVEELLGRMTRDGITVSTVALGKNSDEPLMASIAKWGRGRYYYTEDLQAIPRIFALETQLASDATMVEQPFRALATDPGHEAIQGIDWAHVPPLGGYVATTAKASAEQLLTSHREDPVLATWRYGLGRAAAFTSDASGRWASQWLRWPEFGRFWSQLVRWTLRSAAPGDTAASVARRDGKGEVLVDAVDAKGDFINFLDSQVGIVAPDRSRSVVGLEQVGPGRYVARFPAKQEGVYLVGMAERKGDRVVGSQVAGLVVPYDEELRVLGVDRELLDGLAETTGGGALTAPAEAFAKARRSFRAAVDLWPWLAAIGLALMLVEIALRRFELDLLARRRRPAAGASRGPALSAS